jgi:dolichyl-phosphate-mannose-protein mannosyltransferase
VSATLIAPADAPIGQTKPRQMARWVLPALVVGCCLLAAAYSVVTPAFEAPDEPGHYAYVQWLLAGNGIPLQGQEPPPLQPEFSQPPLYYLVEAPFAWLAGGQPANLPDWEPQHNPFQNATDYGNVNLYFHLPREGFPWSGEVLGLHLMRLANLAFVALMVLATYGCALELGWRRPPALLAAALVGLIPQLLFMGGALNADNAIGSMSALALYLLLRWLNRGPSARLAALLGLALGAAALSKLSGLAAVAVGLGFMAVRTVRLWLARRPAPAGGSPHLASPRAVGEGLRDTVTAGAVAGVVAGWWYVRDWVALGDPLGWSAMLPATGSMQRAVPLDFAPAAGRLLYRVWTGLAVFGWANLQVDLNVYRVALAVGAVAVVAAGVGAWLAARKGRPRLAHWVLPVWFLAFFVALARWVQVNSAADQWRLLFPVYPVLALVAAYGLWTLARGWRRALLALPAALLALNVGAMALTIAPAYAAPAPYSGPIEHLADVRFGDALQLAGWSTPAPQAAKSGEPLEIDLYWRALAPIATNYATDLASLDAGSHVVWKRQSMPDEGRAPMNQWRPGMLMLDRHRVRVDPSMEGSQTLLLSVIDPVPPGDHLAAVSGGQRLANDTVNLGRFLAEPASQPQPAVKDGVAFQGNLQLAGHSTSQAAGKLTLTLDWKATAAVPKDYTVFVHMLDAGGKQVAQNDSQPQGGAFPTSLLPAGFEAPDSHVLDVAGLPPGDYRLEVGLYELASGARLATQKGDASVLLPVRLD